MWTNRTTTAQFLAGKRTPCAVAVVAAAVLSPSSYTYSQLVPNSFIFGGYNFIKYALTDRTWNNQGTREKGEWGMGNGRNNHTTNNDVIYGEKLEFIAVRPLLAHPIRIHLHYCYCSSICRAVLWWHNGSPCHLLGFYCASDLRSFTLPVPVLSPSNMVIHVLPVVSYSPCSSLYLRSSRCVVRSEMVS